MGDRSEEKYGRNNSADTKVSEEVGGGASGSGAEIPPQPKMRPHGSILKDSSLWEWPTQEQLVKNWIPQEGLHPEEGEYFPQIKSVLPMMVMVRDLPVLISTHKLFHLIFFLCVIEDTEWERGWVGIWQQAKVNPTQLIKV